MSVTLARTAARVAARVLASNKGAEHQCIRIKNLDAEEVVQFVKAWPVMSIAAGQHQVRLVVADDMGGRIPAEHVAEVGCTITLYRNNNRQGLVYVETSTQSDAQGLQNMFTLSDSNLLDKSFDDHAVAERGVSGLLVQEAWSFCGGHDSVPALLLDRVLKVLSHVHPGVFSVSVRRFVDFAEQVCRSWRQQAEMIDGLSADRVIGESLWTLEKLFPDVHWHEGGSDTRSRRRIAMNFRHADLMDGTTELNAEEVAVKARSVRFVGGDGKPLPTAQSSEWSKLCTQYGRDRDLKTRRNIPYSIFSQLFSRDTAGLRLGDRLRTEIENVAPDRLAEFDALDLTAGLNTRNSHAAVQLQDAIPPVGFRPLIDLATAKTRKSIERLVVPPRKRFFNPAIEIVRQVQRVQADLQGSSIARLEIEVIDSTETWGGNPSIGLLAFLFGPTLGEIASECDGQVGGCQLIVDERLLRQHEAPKRPDFLEYNETDDETVDELVWSPVTLRFVFKDAADDILEVVDQLEWYPDAIGYFALLWLLVVAPDSPAFASAGALKITNSVIANDWLTPIVSRQIDLTDLTVEPDHVLGETSALIDDLLQLRRSLRSSLAGDGLAIPALEGYLDAWKGLLLEARRQYVPDGVRIREMDAFLGTDLLRVEGSDRRIMLALHPIRLRWVCGYLRQTRTLACDLLSGDAAFSDGEGRFYLDWLENRTPRESPPIAVGHQGQVLYSRSELAWCEDFSPQRSDTGDVSCDDEAIASIAARISSYLDAHPYKRDGLSLLIVLPTSDTMPAEILRRVTSGANRSVRVSVVVAAPKKRWEAIARAVESVTGDGADVPRARLFPDRDLSLVDYEPDRSLEEFLAEQQIDIAVVTHVLQEKIISQQNTEVPAEHAGVFDPLAHRPLRVETGSGGSMSLVMLPRYSDPVLESWSTLVVRSNRCKPVAPGQPENTDLVELRVSFQDSARLFNSLHAHCHWVITLERHITREQIESIEAAPDVLSIQDGVGANRLSTLVVSSRTGRDLVRSRLMRKLERLLPHRPEGEQGQQLLRILADGVYESTRRFSPRLALQALGVARFTEEIIGLTVARHLAEDRFPVRSGRGISAWLSLDEHTDWFGGSDQVRADMCRLSLELGQDGAATIDVLVVEGKLRQAFDPHGVEQARRTCDFFRAVLSGTGVDAVMWRELLATAIESVSENAVRIHEVDGSSHAILQTKDHALSALRMGPVTLRDTNGVYSICLWDNDEEHVRTDQQGTVVVLQSGRRHLIDLLSERSSYAPEVKLAAVPALSSVVEYPVPSAAVDGGHDSTVEHAPAASDAMVADVSEDGSDVTQEAMVEHLKQNPVAKARSRRSLSDEALRRIYENMLGCFDMHGVSVSAVSVDEVPFLEGPASILFKVRPAPGVDPRKLFEKTAALKLALSLAQEQSVSFGIDRGVVTIDVPKSPEQRYFVDASDSWRRWNRPASGLAVPLGEDRFGELVDINFSSPNSPHLLIAGTTGSGKSEALNTILFGLVHHYGPEELRLMLVDPKGTELLPFQDSPYLEGRIGWDEDDAIQLLTQAVEEMQRRYSLFKQASATVPRRSLVEYNESVSADQRLPWWLLVLDEYADLTHDPQVKKAIEGELKRLAQKARAAGIHVIIATQKPSAEVISTNLRSNLPAQLALRVKSATESRVVIDEAGAENLNGKGDALLKSDGRLQRVQCSRYEFSSSAQQKGQPIKLPKPM